MTRLLSLHMILNSQLAWGVEMGDARTFRMGEVPNTGTGSGLDPSNLMMIWHEDGKKVVEENQ